MPTLSLSFVWGLVLLNALCPLVVLVLRAATSTLGANPIGTALQATGDLGLLFLLLTLAVTPLRKLSGWQQIGKLRRMLGLVCFFYAALHVALYVGVDQSLDLRFVAVDVFERPFVTLGLLAFLFLIPLAATSTNRMIKRLGGKRWQKLHRRVYPIGVLAVLHYAMVVKADRTLPFVAAGILALELFVRLWFFWASARLSKVKKATSDRMPLGT